MNKRLTSSLLCKDVDEGTREWAARNKTLQKRSLTGDGFQSVSIPFLWNS